MLTGEIRGQIEDVWLDFATGGVSNPLTAIEQITCLLFIKRLDVIDTNEEKKSAQLKTKRDRRLFPPGKDKIGKDGGCPYSDMRWSRFKTYEPRRMFEIVDEHEFPFLRTLANGNHMKDARNGESPFTDFNPSGIAGLFDDRQVTKVIHIIEDVNRGAGVKDQSAQKLENEGTHECRRR